MMFKRQFVKYQFGKSEQGIDLYQEHGELHANGRKNTFNYAEVANFASGKLTYMLDEKPHRGDCAEARICKRRRSGHI